jgi:hypothetical protein
MPDPPQVAIDLFHEVPRTVSHLPEEHPRGNGPGLPARGNGNAVEHLPKVGNQVFPTLGEPGKLVVGGWAVGTELFSIEERG